MSVRSYVGPMPTLLRNGQYRFYIVMFDCRERKHVHVSGGGPGRAKLWLEPEIGIEAIRGYTDHDVARLKAIAREFRETLVRRWIEECGMWR